MKTALRQLAAILGVTFAVASWANTQDYGKVELLRDTWGVPHVFSDTDRGAMYGLGYATAQERGFQMTYGLRIMQGRLAEVIGDRPKGGRRETALDSDRRMRTFGWGLAAARIARNLDADTLGLLQAYCEGVNASFEAQQKAGTLHPLFHKLDVTPEKWTPADCLLSWWQVAQYFAGDGTRDLMVWHNRLHPQPGQPPPPQPGPAWADEQAAVVQRQDVNESWLREMEQFCSAKGLSGRKGGNTNEMPRFSHAWVVGRKKTMTGSAVLVSDPQTPVRNPSLWMEFHVKGTRTQRQTSIQRNAGSLIRSFRKYRLGEAPMKGARPTHANKGPGLSPEGHHWAGSIASMVLVPWIVRRTLRPRLSPASTGRPSTAKPLSLTHNGCRATMWIRRKQFAPSVTAIGPTVPSGPVQFGCGEKLNFMLHP